MTSVILAGIAFCLVGILGHPRTENDFDAGCVLGVFVAGATLLLWGGLGLIVGAGW